MPAQDKLSPTEQILAYLIGGGIALAILALFLYGIGVVDTDYALSFLLVGLALIVIGIGAWLYLLRPWESFDDLKTPHYTGHAHDDHGEHGDHAAAVAEGEAPAAATGTKAAPAAAAAAAAAAVEAPAEVAAEADAVVADAVEDAEAVAAADAEAAAEAPADVAADPEAVVKDAEAVAVADVEAATEAPAEVTAEADAAVAAAEPVAVADAEAATEAPAEVAAETDAVVEDVAEAGEPDDLTVIEGVGPKSAEALVSSGVSTYKTMADMTPEALEETVKAKKVRLVGSTSTWPMQAELAANGEFEALDTLKDRIKGGFLHDDLTKIEGVGPKAQEALNEAGYRSYEDVAGADVDALKAVLDAAKLKLLTPDTWPQQAELLAKGDLDALKALQDRLTGGRE